MANKANYEIVAQAAYDKKAKSIEILNMKEITLMDDYVIICSANSTKQTQSIADNIKDKMVEAGYEVYHTEGYRSGDWVLLDMGDVVAHVFVQEAREYYDLENLWCDAERVPFEGE